MSNVQEKKTFFHLTEFSLHDQALKNNKFKKEKEY